MFFTKIFSSHVTKPDRGPRGERQVNVCCGQHLWLYSFRQFSHDFEKLKAQTAPCSYCRAAYKYIRNSMPCPPHAVTIPCAMSFYTNAICSKSWLNANEKEKLKLLIFLLSICFNFISFTITLFSRLPLTIKHTIVYEKLQDATSPKTLMNEYNGGLLESLFSLSVSVFYKSSY